MAWLTDLAEVARRTGYPVVEVPGWRTRGHGPQPDVQGIVCHHTAGWDDRHVVVNGRRDLPGPLSQFWLEHTGRIHVVAAGRCWHNAPSTSARHSNSTSLGIEAENRGDGRWPAVQVDAYVRLCAVLCRHYGLGAERVRAHREVNTGKNDPRGIDMSDFRSRVATMIKEGVPVALSREDAIRVWRTDGAVPAPDGSRENPTWQAANVLTDANKRIRHLETQVAEILDILRSRT